MMFTLRNDKNEEVKSRKSNSQRRGIKDRAGRFDGDSEERVGQMKGPITNLSSTGRRAQSRQRTEGHASARHRTAKPAGLKLRGGYMTKVQHDTFLRSQFKDIGGPGCLQDHRRDVHHAYLDLNTEHGTGVDAHERSKGEQAQRQDYLMLSNQIAKEKRHFAQRCGELAGFAVDARSRIVSRTLTPTTRRSTGRRSTRRSPPTSVEATPSPS